MPIELKSVDDIQDLIVTVMGLGRYSQGSGVGAAKWLLRHGAQIVITDLKTEKELKQSVDLVSGWYEQYRQEYPDRDIYQPVFVLGQHREDDFVNVQMVVKNPDVPGRSEYVELARKHGVRVESDVSLFFHFSQNPKFVVTGTRGKSTTASLLGAILRRAQEKTVVAGNIMHSPLEELDWLVNEPETPVVLELSSWLLESLEHLVGKAKGPDIAVFTNVSKDHLDRYESFESYVDAKALMFRLQSEGQLSVANHDDDIVRKAAEAAPSKTSWFSLRPLPEGLEGAFLNEAGDLILRMEGRERKLCHVSEWPALQGEHNAQNALSAALAGALAGVPDADICEALRAFDGLDGRQQTVREWNKVTFVNDTTATSPAATIAALRRFGDERRHIVLIVGGKAKGFEFDELAAEIRTYCKHAVYLEGSHTTEIEEAVGPDLPHDHATSMEEAVEKAAAAAKEGDVVLLSPATSSFDLFKNEFDRGGQFVEAVKNLKGDEGERE